MRIKLKSVQKIGTPLNFTDYMEISSFSEYLLATTSPFEYLMSIDLEEISLSTQLFKEIKRDKQVVVLEFNTEPEVDLD